MTPTPAALEMLANRNDFLATMTAMLINAQLEMENARPDWGKVFNDVYLILGRVETMRQIDASLQRMMSLKAGGLES